MVIDSYRILEPYGRDLEPEAHWLESFSATAKIWLTWILAGGEEVEGHRPLTTEERATAVAFLKRAKDTSGILDVVLSDQPFRSVQLDQVAELRLAVTA